MQQTTQHCDIGGGILLFGVFNAASLPADVRAALAAHGEDATGFRQLFLFGHVGRAMWEAVADTGAAGAAGRESPDPIDEHSVRVVDSYFETEFPGVARRLLYPGSQRPLPLQTLGELAGIHHASPFMVGIDARWGSWFAYRAVVLANTDTAPTVNERASSPCDACAHRVCISRCPAGALEGESFDLGRCVAYRRQPDSGCRETCLARTSCPVGEAHRYDDAQLRYHYGRSMRTIESYFAAADHGTLDHVPRVRIGTRE